MESEDLVDRTIATVRASMIAELRTMANGHPQETMTSGQVMNIVDWALGEASEALKDALGSETEQNRWWNDPYQDGPTEYFRGGITRDYPLPRVRRDGLQ